MRSVNEKEKVTLSLFLFYTSGTAANPGLLPLLSGLILTNNYFIKSIKIKVLVG
jgi:acyl-coenzyme A synthetase/AMP-(fatty) acid ligase